MRIARREVATLLYSCVLFVGLRAVAESPTTPTRTANGDTNTAGLSRGGAPLTGHAAVTYVRYVQFREMIPLALRR